MKKTLYSFLILWFGIILVSSCSPELYQYHQVAPEATHEHYREIPIYVDARMTQYGKDNLAAALNEANMMLNGSMSFSVKSWSMDINSENGRTTLETIRETHNGLMVIWTTHDDKLVEEFRLGEGVMAFVNGIGKDADMLVILKDRIISKDLKIIYEHELSHSLGAVHSNAVSLMYPYDVAGLPRCFDFITVAQIANYNHIDVHTLNYCSTNEVK